MATTSLTLTNLNASAAKIAAAAGVKMPKLTGANWSTELGALAGKVGPKGSDG